MAEYTATILDACRSAYSSATDAIKWADWGSWINTWHLPINSLIQALNGMFDLANGQLLIGNATAGRPSKATLTAGSSITITNAAGSITIGIANGAIGSDALAAGSVTTGKLSSAARTQFLLSDELDLGGAAQAVPVFKPSLACTISRIAVLYTVASDSNTGVAIKVGKPTDDDYFYTGTSEVSISQWSEGGAITPLATGIAAGDLVLVSTAGGKTGTGKIRFLIEYYVN